jgi:hypothetical protein
MLRKSLMMVASSLKPRLNSRKILPWNFSTTAQRNDSQSQRSQWWPSVLHPM